MHRRVAPPLALQPARNPNASDRSRRPAKRCKGGAGGGRDASTPAADVARVVIAVDHGVPGATVDALRAVATALPAGGFVCVDHAGALPAVVTHLVREDSDVWTLRTHFAAARGRPVVTPAWVFASLEAGRWLAEDAFVCGRLGVVNGALGTSPRALHGKRICIWGTTFLPPRVLEELVLAAGGSLADHRHADVLVADDARKSGLRSRSTASSRWILNTVRSAARGQGPAVAP